MASSHNKVTGRRSRLRAGTIERPTRATRGANATATPKMTGKMSLPGCALDGGIGLALASPKLHEIEKSSHLQRFAY
jgi:hypothetical protein